MDVDSELIVIPSEREAKLVPTAVSQAAELILQKYRTIKFRGRALVQEDKPYPHFVPLHKDRFDPIGYLVMGGVSRSKLGDVFAYVCGTAEDFSSKDHLIGFGVDVKDAIIETDTDLEALHKNKPVVWNTRDLCWEHSESVNDCVWRSPYAPIKSGDRVPFIMQLAGNDPEVYDDIMQSLAPLVMENKPDGVIWWVGAGANGKSTLMDAIYKIFPGQLSSLTVKRLTDGRDTPSLNGTLANIVKETSEGRIDDTEVYKSIGTHENFRVHKFHSQDDIEIRGNLHHIFNANIIPSFNDKGYAAKRRTFIVPFNQRFESDPTFERRAFTPEMFGRLVAEICKYAERVAQQGYHYKWSAATLAAKAEYDAEASNAEEYARNIIEEGVVAFDNFHPAKMDYENWCGNMGYVPLGIGNLRRALQALGFERVGARDDGRPSHQYRLPNFKTADLQPFNAGRPGLYTVAGFQKQPDSVDPPEFDEEPADEPVKTKTKLRGEW